MKSHRNKKALPTLVNGTVYPSLFMATLEHDLSYSYAWNKLKKNNNKCSIRDLKIEIVSNKHFIENN